MYLTRQNYHYLSHSKRWEVDWKTCAQASTCVQVDDTIHEGRMSLKGAVQLLQELHLNLNRTSKFAHDPARPWEESSG